MFALKQINIFVGAVILVGFVVSSLSCPTNSTTNCNSTTKKVVSETSKPTPLELNDTKIGAASSESRQVVEGLTAYSKFNSEGGFQPSPFLGLVTPELPRSREAIGFGEAIPVPIHETHPENILRQRLFPQRGYAAKPSLTFVQDNHLQDELHYAPPPHPFGIHDHQEQHHQIPGHSPDLSVQAEISVQPEPTPHPELSVHSTITNNSPELSGRHPTLSGHPLKIPGYNSHDHYPYHISDSLHDKPDFGQSLQFSQSPVIFPDEGKFGKETYPNQLAFSIPHDVKPVEEDQHDDGLPAHIDAHPPTLKGHSPPHESFLHKISPWKGVIKFLATLVPLGLLVAALQPSIVLVNATEPPLRPVPVAPGLVTKFRAAEKGLVASGVGETCDKRQLCDALVSSATTPIHLQLAYVALASRLKGEQKQTLDEVMERVAGRNCKYYSCPSLLAAPTQATRR